MMVMSILSILLYLFFPVLIVLFIRHLSKNVQNKRLTWIFGGYCGVLILSILVLNMVPNENLFKGETVKQNSLNYEKEVQDFYDAAEEGNLDKVDGVYKSGPWSFDFTGNSLEIAQSEDLGITIIAERKNTNDGIVEIAHYRTQSIINGIDFTKEIKAPKVALRGNKLVITTSGPYEVKYVMFKKDFTVSQFGEGSNEERDIHDNVAWFGSQVLYLRVPKKVNIDNTAYKVEFVGEK